MAYENLQLVVAALSGDIYLARVNKNGMMGESRRVLTEDCLRASAEWFMKNEKKMIQYGANSKGKQPTLFYTDNPEKAQKVLEILRED